MRSSYVYPARVLRRHNTCSADLENSFNLYSCERIATEHISSKKHLPWALQDPGWMLSKALRMTSS
jgi:hypothetical protein